MGGKKREFELTLELGHRSAPLKTKSPNGYTHKWTVFVRGVNDSKIENCIQKVVFQLHDSFDNPHRHILAPPYEVTETGYAGFEIPIEIYFKNKERPNHLVYVHDLCLLKNKPNDATSVQKIKFIHPTKEFERLLQKSGAQPLKVPMKKERSDSPPAKKQKSSSLIPSKDMSKQSQSQPTNHVQDSHNNSSSNNRQQILQQQPQPPKTSSKQFIDVFGAPLLYHSNNPSSTTTPSTSASTTNSTHNNNNLTTNSLINNSLLTTQSTTPTLVTNATASKHSGASNHSSGSSSSGTHNNNNNTISGTKSEKKDEHFFDLQSMQSKISCISDSERLQRIVDIVEGAGEWYNVTPKKFEFDLKRLDRKTLFKIERCLQY